MYWIGGNRTKKLLSSFLYLLLVFLRFVFFIYFFYFRSWEFVFEKRYRCWFWREILGTNLFEFVKLYLEMYINKMVLLKFYEVFLKKLFYIKWWKTSDLFSTTIANFIFDMLNTLISQYFLLIFKNIFSIHTYNVCQELTHSHVLNLMYNKYLF